MEDVSMPSGPDKPDTSEKPAVVTGPATIPANGLLSMKGIDTCSTCAAQKYDTYSQRFVGTGQEVKDSYPPMFDTQLEEIVGKKAYPEDIDRDAYSPLTFDAHSKRFVGPDDDDDDDDDDE
jgi:hypothetical protein